MRSGKPTTTCAKEPGSAIIRLGETIFWSRAALRFSLGSWSHDSIWGMNTSAGGQEHDGTDNNKKKRERRRNVENEWKEEWETHKTNYSFNVPEITLVERASKYTSTIQFGALSTIYIYILDYRTVHCAQLENQRSTELLLPFKDWFSLDSWTLLMTSHFVVTNGDK